MPQYLDFLELPDQFSTAVNFHGTFNDLTVSKLPNGNAVLRWEEYSDGNRTYYTQIYDSSGLAVGDQNISARYTYYSGVADFGGGALREWDQLDSDGNKTYHAQVYDSSGLAVGDEIISFYGLGNVSKTTLPSGGGLLEWKQFDVDRNETKHAQVYDSSGLAVGDEIIGNQLHVEFTDLGGGNAIIHWVEIGSDGNNTYHAQFYDSSGSPVGDQIFGLFDQQVHFGVHAMGDGTAVLDWREEDADGEDTYHVQFYDPSGSPVGNEISSPFVPKYSNNTFLLGIDPLGDDVVFVRWIEQHDRYDFTTHAQIYDSSGLAVGDEIVGDMYLPYSYIRIQYFRLEDDRGLLTWDKFDSDGNLAPHAQIYDSSGLPVGNEIVGNGFAEHFYGTDFGNGTIAIRWREKDSDDITTRHTQIYDSSGSAVGDEIVSAGSYVWTWPLGSGGAIVTWTELDANGDTVFHAQFYDSSGLAIGDEIAGDPGYGFSSDTGSFRTQPFEHGAVLSWVESDANGDWVSYAQFYDSSGSAIGDEIVGSADFTVSSFGDGNFVLKWAQKDSDGNVNYYTQVYGSSGVALSDAVISPTGNTSRVTLLGDGGVVISWIEQHDGYHFSSHAQFYDSSGLAIGDEVVAASFTTGDISKYLDDEDFVRVIPLGDGGVLLEWNGYFDGERVAYGQFYDSSGLAVGDQIIGSTNYIYINSLVDGVTLLRWIEMDSDGVSTSHAQFYDSSGLAVGDQIVSSLKPEADQSSSGFGHFYDPLLGDGGIMLNWTEYDSDGMSTSHAQFYDSSGLTVGDEIVGTLTYDEFGKATGGIVARSLDDGGVVISWAQEDSDGNTIYKNQMFDADGLPAGTAVSSTTPRTVVVLNDNTVGLISADGESMAILSDEDTFENGRSFDLDVLNHGAYSDFFTPVYAQNGELFGLSLELSWSDLPQSASEASFDVQASIFLSRDGTFDDTDIFVGSNNVTVANGESSGAVQVYPDYDAVITYDFGDLFPDLTGDYYVIVTYEAVGLDEWNMTNNQISYFDFGNPTVSFDSPPVDHATTAELFEASGGKVAFLAELSLAAYYIDQDAGHEVEVPDINNQNDRADDAYEGLPEGFELLDAVDLPGLELTAGSQDGFWRDGIANGIFTEENGAALVGRSEDALFIAFRGTNGLADMADWVDTYAHQENFQPLYAELQLYLLDNPEITTIYLTGHSLGGAMAEISFREGRLEFNGAQTQAVTFASPGAFGAATNDPEYVVSNYQIRGDIVPSGNIVYNTSGDRNVIEHNLGKFASNVFGFPTWQGQTETTASVIDGELQERASLSVGDLHSMKLYSNFMSFFESQDIFSTYQNGKDYDIIIAHGTAINIDDQNYDIGSAADNIYGGGSAEIILGGSGADLIKGGRGDDYIKGGTHSDTIKGGWGHDYIDAGTGHDTVKGGLKNDEIHGGNGNDTLSGNQGLDTIYGGDGNDDIFGGSGADHLYGNANNDNIEGGNGSDIIKGGDGYDVIYGGDGNDTIYGNKDNDIIYGGKRADDLFGDKGKDTIYGGGGNDDIDGGEKSDWLYGGNDEDTILGGDGKDTIDGGNGVDSINGNEDNDKITGGLKGDKLWGGLGKDTFIFTSVKDSTVEKQNTGADRIYDFGKGGSRDVFDLSKIDAKWGAISNYGDQKFTFIDDDIFSNTKGELRTEIKGNNTIIEADTNGDGDADLTILLKGAHVLVESDFIL